MTKGLHVESGDSGAGDPRGSGDIGRLVRWGSSGLGGLVALFYALQTHTISRTDFDNEVRRAKDSEANNASSISSLGGRVSTIEQRGAPAVIDRLQRMDQDMRDRMKDRFTSKDAAVLKEQILQLKIDTDKIETRIRELQHKIDEYHARGR